MKTIDWIKFFVFGLLLTGIYYSTFTWLITEDWHREDYNYGWLIPAVVLYLLWDNRESFRSIPSSPAWAGFLLLLPGLFLFWLGELAGEFFSQYLSFSLILIALCWIVLGFPKLKTILFALIFTLAMFPPPHFIHDNITFKLKLISSEIGVKMLHLMGMSAYREGNIIDLGFTQLQVVDACSGLRYLLPLLIMAILLCYFFRGSVWKKLIIIASSVPLTIITNSFRIAATGVLFKFWGPAVAEGFFHGFSGWFIFMFGLAFLLFEIWMLSGFQKITKIWHSPSDKPGPSAGGVELPDGKYPKSSQSYFNPPQFIIAVGLLAATYVVLQTVDFRQQTPSAQSFSQFPLQIGEWNGDSDTIEQEIIDTLDLTDYFVRNYRGSDKKIINAYSAYYESQKKGASIHSPETCLPGSGWGFEEAGSAQIPLPNSSHVTVEVNRAIMTKGDSRQLSYYWFPQRDRILTNAYQLKWYNFWDALTRQRTDGALVRLITPIYPGEGIEEADARLTVFMGDFLPVYDQFLPH